jgi:glycosyltransferase involved in cell wall biosynthesis
MAPLRFLLVSTHTEQMTGYAKVSYNLLKQLATLSPMVKVFHYGFQRSPVRAPNPMRPLPPGVTQYDASLNEEPKQEGFGFRQLKDYIETVSPDVVMIYNDPLVILRFMQAMELKPGEEKSYKLWVYLDQVYKDCNPTILRPIEQLADATYVFTEGWKEHLQTKYLNKESAIRVLEHGVDTRVFHRLNEGDRLAIRKSLNIPSNAIVYLNMNRNSTRKRLDLSIMAFVRLLARNPDTPLYLMFVTAVRPEHSAHYGLPAIFMHELEKAGLEPIKYSGRLLVVDSAPPKLFDDNQINLFYNATDIGLNTSNGEGFGLCQLEHLATGAPQVVVNIGGYDAFLNDKVAVRLPASQYAYLGQGVGVGLVEESASVDEISAGMEKALGMLTPEVRHDAIEIGLRRPWARICDPFLEDVIALTNA